MVTCACGQPATTRDGQCRTCYKREWRRARSAAWAERERKVVTARVEALELPAETSWPTERIRKGGKRTSVAPTPGVSGFLTASTIVPAYGSNSNLSPIRELSSTEIDASPTLGTASDDLEEGLWESIRDGWTQPRVRSAYTGAEPHRAELLSGARALAVRKLYPQQLVVADVLNACRFGTRPLHPTIAVLISRRSTKSTTVLATILGRCRTRPGYLAGITFATTGTKLAQRFKMDYFDTLRRTIGEEVTLGESNGHEVIKFRNGSRIDLLPPKASSFRSEAYDCVWIDEAGEAPHAMSEELLLAALPTFDTRPDSQLIVSGTAPEFRVGNLLWDTLEHGRHGLEDTGIVEYSAGVDLTLEDVETWELAEPLVLAAHPGIGTVTSLEKVRGRYGPLGPMGFAREYLSIAGDKGSSAGALSLAKLSAAELTEDFPELPAEVAFAFGASAGTACIAASWRDPAGIARVVLVDHREGTAEWLPASLDALARKRPRAPFAHDDRGPVMVAVEEIRRSRSRARLEKQNTMGVTNAATLLQRELHTGKLRHYGQAEFLAAARIARKRDIGKAWAFGRPDTGDDILAIEVASLALRMYDEMPHRRPVQERQAS